MKKLISLISLAFFIFAGNISFVAAQETDETAGAVLKAVIGGVKEVEVGKSIILDASQSLYRAAGGGQVTYSWDLGDGTIINGEEIVHTYQNPGNYIVRLTVEQDSQRHTVETVIFAYKRVIVFVTDHIQNHERILKVVEEAKRAGTWVKVIDASTSAPNFSTESILTKRLVENKESIARADTIIYWPQRSLNFNVLPSFYREISDGESSEEVIDFSNKSVIYITEGNITNVTPFAQVAYNLMRPKNVIITRKEVVIPVLLAEKDEEVLGEMEFIQTVIINEESSRWQPWNAFYSMTQHMLQKGIPSNMIILILMLPIIASIVAFARQVIGLMTFGVYTPTVIAISFIALGFVYGLAILLIILVAGALTRMYLQRFRMLYIPKVAIVFTTISFVMFCTIALGSWFDITVIASLAIFPMLIMMTLGEKFLSIQSGKGITSALFAMGETVAVSSVCYFIATTELLQSYVLNYPGLMFLIVIAFNIFLGRFTGLRLKEYFRFRAVFKAIEE